jgi:hypothetical protein
MRCHGYRVEDRPQIRVGGVGKDVDKIERVAVAPESDPPRICSNYSFSFLTLLTRNLIIEKLGRVKSLPVRCLFRFSPPDRASRLSRRFATIKLPFPPRPRPSLHSTLYFILSPLSALPWGRRLPFAVEARKLVNWID